MGGTPVVAVNLLGWPRDLLPVEFAAEVLRGGLDVARSAGCHVAGGHSVDDPEPKYGMAVTGVVTPDRLLRNDAAHPGQPLTLTKPLGVGVLNNRHKTTGEVFPHAVATMTTLNADAARAALDTGARCATDVTGFGLLGHLHKLARASEVTAVVESGRVPYLDGARESLAAGHVSGGTRRKPELGQAVPRSRRSRRGRVAAPRRRPDLGGSAGGWRGAGLSGGGRVGAAAVRRRDDRGAVTSV
jgi:selenide,water dikinase